MYTNGVEVMNLIKKLKVNKKNIKRVLISLGIGGSLLFSNRNFGLHLNDDFKPDFYYLNTKNIEMSCDELRSEFENIFESSPVLVKEFSSIYPEVSEFIGEYGEYLDQEQLLDTISKLNVDVVNDEKYGEKVLAWYTFENNTIHIKDKIKYMKDENVKELKEHEFFHYLFFQGFSRDFLNLFHTGHAIDEGMSTLLTQENGDFKDTVLYKKNANYVRVICELIGEENFMSACGNHSFKELLNYLSEYSSKVTSKKLIKCIDKACINYGYIATSADEDAWSIINDMYENKNGISIEDSDDYIMKYYSNKIIKTCYKIEGAESSLDINVYKNYFLNIDKPRIDFIKDGEVYGQVILEDNTSPNNKVKSK